MNFTVAFELMMLIPSAAIGILVWMAAGGHHAARQQPRQVLKRY